jgi:hypothetical protein
MTKTELKLIQKIGAARSLLEKRIPHSVSCPVDCDPDYMGPCTCGASKTNNTYQEVLNILDLEDIAED